MDIDITSLLEDWPFDVENNIRRIEDHDGNELIQVRVEDGPFRGILQMNLDGRPDGTQPHGQDFALEYYEARYGASSRPSTDEGFILSRKACEELFDESRRIYERYVFLLQLADYDRVIADTTRNMRLFRFVNRHAAHEDDRTNLERWWPYVLRVHGTARCLRAAQNGDHDQAVKIISDVRREITELSDVDAQEFFVERERSLEALDSLESSLDEQREPTRREALEIELDRALANEAYELAATLRDELQGLDDVRG